MSRIVVRRISHKRQVMHRLPALLVALTTAALSLGFSIGAGPAAAVVHQQINGSGSSWAANAINQWISDVSSEGLQVVFTSSGSAAGRTDYRNVTTDFAVSDIGFQGVDPLTGVQDTNCINPANKSTCRPYAYEPIVAGGTSFPYQIRVAGKLVRNLRLSGETLAKIFTNKITNWDDKAITEDNNGHALPSIPIIPVVHSEGSGSTAQFTRWLATEYPSLWKSFTNGRSGYTEYFPHQNPQVPENGSDQVINFLTSAAANGAIGYDEYSYALGKNYPVVNLENKAGYFVPPTQYNVAVALTKAKIDYQHGPNYLLQNLNGVYTMPDKRAYPMSSYSYAIIPTSPKDPRMNTAKRQTLADFLDYDVCQGQAEMGPIGYSPLPINLVEASFKQTKLLHTADHAVQIDQNKVTACHNPTFVAGHPTENYLAKIAPEPPACDKVGQGPCGDGADVVNSNPQNGKAPSSPGGNSGANPSGDGNQGGNAPADTGSQPGTGPGGSTPSGSKTTIDPATGQQVTSPDVATEGNANAVASPSTLPNESNGGIGRILAVLAVLELLAVLVLPPIIAHRIQRRKQAS